MKTQRSSVRIVTLVSVVACSALLLMATTVFGQSCSAPPNTNIFNITLCVEGEVATVGVNSIAEVFNAVDSNRLTSRFSGYDQETSAGEFRIDLRGLPVTLGYARDSTVLYFTIPSLGINETFDGGTRDASNQLLRDYLNQNGNGSGLLGQLLAVSPVDPLAGNPASLLSEMVADDFAVGVDPAYNSMAPGRSFSAGLRFGRYEVANIAQNVFTLPLSYAYTFANYDSLIVRLPLTYIEIQGATSYRGQLGLSYKKTIFSRWALTPSLAYGIAGSGDLGSLGHLLSMSLTSDLRLFDNGRFSLSMGNLLGYYLTLPVRVDDVNVDYDLRNTITRNGLLLSMPLQQRFGGREFSLDFFVTGTWFFGDALYNDNYQEIGISIGPRRSVDKLAPNLASHPFGLGLKYIHGKGGIEGFEFNFGYRF
jgi:hypothetical protein